MIDEASPLDVAWLAGLLEGEAAFDLHRQRYPRVRLAMTDRDTVEHAARLMGASVRCSLNAAPASATWHAEISGPKAEQVMRAILPHMHARRSQRIASVLGHAPATDKSAPKVACTPAP
ncbi:hypothetical protein [Micromonospora sp. NPDC047730]|uniref:hypothetical protein n=1 Tax=Micromonospora sp. NPDC047730 TaxID=3364253 RepID=UPI0037232F80